ncbi:MAG: nucleotide sugar dehydrogenase [Thermotogae bacterium]|jgi:UDP-N-acetyl-D-glucosamine dehydrogenase|nr:nucleotide sugar dehydrogenase [Thermotogota bacterium]MCL5031919.1 nucleotide sugar dehydrogenase [Thermotogota bacterium]
MTLFEKITSRKATVGVMGLGYVGLPLAVEKAKAGFNVVGFDVQKIKVDMVNAGHNYIGDIVDSDLEKLVKEKKLRATIDFDEIKNCDVVTICVPTPLDKFKQPDLTYIIDSTKEIKPRLHKGMLVTLESTTYPGTTNEVVLPILEETGLKVGKDFFLAFSPERVDPGNFMYKTKNTPKIVGGVTGECTKHAKAMYEAILEAPVKVVSSPKEAEMAKILENTFRIVNIALANEMALVSNKMGINYWEVVDAAATKPFGFMPFYPGPGVGGHCIPIDPFYLTYKAREYDYHTRLIELAGEINDSMSEYVVERLSDLLNERKKCLNGSKILVMGIAYKGDIDDIRESPALKVVEHLDKKGSIVIYHDPYIPQFTHHDKIYKSVALTQELLKSLEGVIITTAHKKHVDYKFLLDNAPLVFDTKNVTKELSLEHEYPNLYVI